MPGIITAPAKVTPPRNRRVAILGDSRTAQNWNNTYASTNTGYLHWANALSGQLVDTDYSLNFGVTGDTTTQMLARIGPVLACNADTVVVFGGTNDALGDPTIQNLTTIIAQLLAANKVVILIAEAPRGDTTNTASRFSGQRLAQHLAVRQWCLEQDGKFKNLYVVDPWPTMASPLSTTGDALSNIFYDGLHPTPAGGRLYGAALVPVFQKLFASRSILPASAADQYEATYAPRGCLNTNPMMTGTAGGRSGSVTGNVASNWTAVCATGGLSVTASLVTDSNGFTLQQLVITGTATDANPIQLFSDAGAGTYAANDVLQSSGLFEIDSGATGIVAYGAVTRIIGSSTVEALDMNASQFQDTPSPILQSVHRGPSIPVVTSPTTARIAARWYPRSSATVSATVRFGRGALRKVI